MHFRFAAPAALLAGGVVALVAAHVRAQPPLTPQVKRVYPVMDLVTPPPDVPAAAPKTDEAPRSRPTREDWLIREIEKSVSPDSWSGCGGRGTLEYYPMTGTLVINQSPVVQKQVADLLTELRQQQDTEVAVEVRMVSVPRAWLAQNGGALMPSAPTAETPVFLTAAQTTRLLKSVDAHRDASILLAPRLTILNGQQGTLHVKEAEAEDWHFVTWESLLSNPTTMTGPAAAGFHLMARPVVSRDGRSVKAALKIEQSERFRVNTSVVIPDGATAVFGEAESAAPVLNNIPYLRRLFANAGDNNAPAVLALVTARVVEAAAPCVPPRAVLIPVAGEPAPALCGGNPVLAAPPRLTPAAALADLLKAYDKACSEGRTAEARKLAQSALEIDPTCFGRTR